MKKIMLLSAAVLALQALPAMAQDGAPKHEGKGKHREAMFQKMFDNQDANKDGKVSEAEFVDHQKAKFKELDGNSDGSVTKEEVKTFGEKKKAEWEARKAEMKAKKEAAPAPAPATE